MNQGLEKLGPALPKGGGGSVGPDRKRPRDHVCLS